MSDRKTSPHPRNDAQSPPHGNNARENRAAPREHEPQQRIGDILRRVREHRREDIGAISDYLRIRDSYLIALENSQYEDLPADAYVIGFLRSYALYLGLDGRGAVDQYRREMAGRRRKPQLSMPQPISEGQAPTTALLTGAAAAAVLLYGLWYWLSTPDKTALETPVALPQSLQESGGAPPPPLQALEPVVIQPAEAPASTAPLPVQHLSTAAKPVETIPSETAAAKDPKEKTAKEPAPAEEKKKEPPQVDVKTKAEPAAPPPFSAAQGSGLMIKAEEETWVLITNGRGETVFDRTLKAGETYAVPAQKGLSLTTGNASGIVISSGSGVLPRLTAASGRVMRAVPLDAEKLKEWTSAAQPNAKKEPAAE